MSTPTRNLLVALVLSTLLLGVAAAGPIYLPLVLNGQAVAPVRTTFRAPAGARLIGATPFVACAADGLRFSAYSIVDNDSGHFEGHTVFRADGAQLVELVAYRSSGSRGSLTGLPLERCGIGGLASVNLQDAETLVLVEETDVSYAILPYPAVACYTIPARPRTIDLIVLHATGGVKSGDLWTLSGRDLTHPVSCHYYVTKLGEIYQLVQDRDIAWHAGVSMWKGEPDCNAYALGIELENLEDGRDPYPQPQLAAVVWLVRSKVREYRIPRERLVRHAEVALPPGRKRDPRPPFPWGWFVEEVYRMETQQQPVPVFPRRYRVKAGAIATIRQAWVRSATKAGELAAGTVVDVDEIKFGEAVGGDDQWLHLADGRGFVHMSALERA